MSDHPPLLAASLGAPLSVAAPPSVPRCFSLPSSPRSPPRGRSRSQRVDHARAPAAFPGYARGPLAASGRASCRVCSPSRDPVRVRSQHRTMPPRSGHCRRRRAMRRPPSPVGRSALSGGLAPVARCPLQRPNPPPLVSVLPASNTASPEPGPATAPLPLPCVRSCIGGRWPEPLTGGALPLVNQKEEKKKGKRRKMKMKMKMKLLKEIIN